MTPLNVQQPETRNYQADGSLEIVGEPFYTIQGEGPFAGRPAVFVRLAGCDLQCPGCDTDYTTKRRRLSVSDLIIECYASSDHSTRLVVVTGGEPFRQNLGPFARELLHNEREVQIETNGTIYPDPPFDRDFPFAALGLTIVCSPKTPTVHPKLRRWVKALKYILDADYVSPEDGLPTTTLGNACGVARPWPDFAGEVFVQPADPRSPVDLDSYFGASEEFQLNVRAAVQSCMKFGYRYSHQVHKEIGVP